MSKIELPTGASASGLIAILTEAAWGNGSSLNVVIRTSDGDKPITAIINNKNTVILEAV